MQVHNHPAPSPALHKALKSSLPYSINLVYRTQHPNRTPDAHILATLSPTSEEVPRCWAAAYIDRSMRPETELWMFAAGEDPSHSSTSNHGNFCPTCRIAVLSLLDYMARLPVPPLHPDNLWALELAKKHEQEHPLTGPSVRYRVDSGSYMRHLLTPSVVTLGACHHQVVQICEDVGLVRPEFPGREAELNKYLFRISDLPQTRELPEELRWGEMRAKDIPLVMSRTNIPRATRTLLSMNSVGVFEKQMDTAIAWAFLGLDGSLTTLHTEPAYRGKGIAKAVAAKIFREHASDLAMDAEGNAWAHADVYVENTQSQSVCRSLGGKALTKIFWVRIDLAQAGTLIEH